MKRIFKSVTRLLLMPLLVQCVLGGMAIPTFAAATTIIINDNSQGTTSPGYSETGTGWADSSQPGFENSYVRYSVAASDSAKWTPTIASDSAGKYNVSIYRADSTLYDPLGYTITVNYNGGSISRIIDMSSLPVGWVDLGVFDFAVGTSGYVQLTYGNATQKTSGKRIIADSVKFEPVTETSGAAIGRLLTDKAYTSTPLTGVSQTSSIALNFSQTMDNSTLTQDNIQLIESNSRNVVASTLDVKGGNFVAITPASALTKATYTVVVGDGVKDSLGGDYSGTKRFAFRTSFVVNAATDTSPIFYTTGSSGSWLPSGSWNTRTYNDLIFGNLLYNTTGYAFATYKPGLTGIYQLIFTNPLHTTATGNVEVKITFNGGAVTKYISQIGTTFTATSVDLGTYPLDSNSTILFTNRVSGATMRLEKLTFIPSNGSDYYAAPPTVINAFGGTAPQYVESGSFDNRGSTPWGTTTIGDFRYTIGLNATATYKPALTGKYKIVFASPKNINYSATNIQVTINHRLATDTQTLSQVSDIDNVAEYVDLGDYTLDINSTVEFKNLIAYENMRVEKLYFFPVIDLNNDYKITPATFKNISDTKITSMTTGTVKASIPITNTRGSSLNTAVIFARYNTAGSLAEVFLSEKAVADFTEENYTAQFDNCESGDRISVFVWDGIGTMKPLLLTPDLLQ